MRKRYQKRFDELTEQLDEIRVPYYAILHREGSIIRVFEKRYL